MYTGLDIFEREIKERGTRFFYGEERCEGGVLLETFTTFSIVFH